MSCYNNFANYYDELMHQDINYEKIADFIENQFTLNNLNAHLICDLACGTGNVTIPLSKRGYDMIAVDKSTDMLNSAKIKAKNENLDILFLNQDISKIDLYGTCDAFLCMIDGVNYIINKNSLLKMFKRIKKCFLNPGGLIIFDISSEYKLSKYIGNNTFIHDGDDIFYSWENKYYKNKKLLHMYLNFFTRRNKIYKRFCEHHLQRAYSEKEIKEILKAAGFKKISVYDSFTFEKPTSKSHRITFVAK